MQSSRHKQNSWRVTGRSRAARAATFALVLTALFLPSLSLIPLGGLYLWEKGYLLNWAIASTLTVGLVYALQRRALASAEGGASQEKEMGREPETTAPSPGWSAIERQAWADVRSIATNVNIEVIGDARALFDLGHRTINTVANRIHAGKKDALWQFTMPEALAISERVSARLGSFIRENIPFGDRLTVSQVLQVYRWRAMTDYAERAYDIWRIIRLSNPATALTNEARERLSRAMLQWGREQISRRLIEAYVDEVGRAAIDLYGGRLDISIAEAAIAMSPPGSVSAEGAILYAPLEIAVIADNDGNSDALTDLLRSMEAQRSASVASYIRGDAGKPASEPALRITQIKMATGSEADTARPKSGSENPSIVLIALSASHPPALQVGRVNKTFSAQSPGSPPIVIPVLLDGDTEAACNARIDDLSSLFTGPIKSPVRIDLKYRDMDANARKLWRAIESVAFDARRLQLMRQLAITSSTRRLFTAMRQSARAAANLAKNALPFPR